MKGGKRREEEEEIETRDERNFFIQLIFIVCVEAVAVGGFHSWVSPRDDVLKATASESK